MTNHLLFPRMTLEPLPKIEKGIPIPDARAHNRKWKDILASMEIGDSFMVLNGNQRSTVVTHAKDYGVLITSRKINGEGYRIWRIG